MKYVVNVDDQNYEVEITELDRGTQLKVDGKEVPVDLKMVNAPSLYSMLMANHSYELLVEEREGRFAVFIETELYEVKVQSEREMRLSRGREAAGRGHIGETEIKAPMPGLVVAVQVQPGEEVAKGRGIVTLEAMKMENEMKAPRAGTVKAILVTQGQKVTQGQLLAVLR